MERGQIRSVTGGNSDGSIADDQGRTINFNSSNIIGRDRSGLKIGDFVWFERLGMNAGAKAINIRRC